MPLPLMLASAVPAMIGGGAVAGGTAAAGAGLFSASTLFPMMMGAGMGLSAMQAFGGGGATGYAPQFAIPLSAEGKKAQKALFEKTKEQYQTGLMPENLASIYIDPISKMPK